MARRQITGRLSLDEVEYVSQAGRDIVTEEIGKQIGGLGIKLGAEFKKAFKQNADILDVDPEAEVDITTTKVGPNPKDTSKLTILDWSKYTPESDLNQANNPSIYLYGKLEEDFKKWYLSQPGKESDLEGLKVASKALIAAAMADNAKNYQTQSPTSNSFTANYVDEKTNSNSYYQGTSNSTKPSRTEQNALFAQFLKSGGGTPPLQRSKETPFERVIGVNPRGQRRQSFRRSGNYAFLNNDLYNLGSSPYIEGSSADSQYTPNDPKNKIFVEKEAKLGIPSYLQGSAAAVEMHNIGVQERNYAKQVKADMAAYLQDSFDGLNVERTGNNLIDQSIQDLMLGQKKELANHINQRQKWFDEGRGTEWSIKMQNLKAVPNQVMNFREAAKAEHDTVKKAIESGEVDFDAMGPYATDYLNTIIQGGNIGLVNTDKGIKLMGSSHNKMPFSQDIQGLLQGTGRPKIIKKKSYMTTVDEIMKDFNPSNGTYKNYLSTVTEDENGFKNTTPRNFEDKALQEVFFHRMKEELKSDDDARALASSMGINFEMYNSLLKANIKDPENNPSPKQVIYKKLMEPLRAKWNVATNQVDGTTREGTARIGSYLTDERQRDKTRDTLASNERIAKAKQIIQAQTNQQNANLFGKRDDLYAAIRGMNPENNKGSSEKGRITALANVLTSITGEQAVGYEPGEVIQEEGENKGKIPIPKGRKAGVFIGDKVVGTDNLPLLFKTMLDESPLYAGLDFKAKIGVVQDLLKDYPSSKESAKIIQSQFDKLKKSNKKALPIKK